MLVHDHAPRSRLRCVDFKAARLPLCIDDWHSVGGEVCVCVLYIHRLIFLQRGGAGYWVGRRRCRGDQNKHSCHGVASCRSVAIYSAPDLCQQLFINLQAVSAKHKHARWLGKYLGEQRRQYLGAGDIKELSVQGEPNQAEVARHKTSVIIILMMNLIKNKWVLMTTYCISFFLSNHHPPQKKKKSTALIWQTSTCSAKQAGHSDIFCFSEAFLP